MNPINHKHFSKGEIPALVPFRLRLGDARAQTGGVLTILAMMMGSSRYLWKKGRGTSRFGAKSWKKRYFMLESSVLSYYTDASLNKKKGRINVYGGAVRLCVENVCIGMARRTQRFGVDPGVTIGYGEGVLRRCRAWLSE